MCDASSSSACLPVQRASQSQSAIAAVVLLGPAPSWAAESTGSFDIRRPSRRPRASEPLIISAISKLVDVVAEQGRVGGSSVSA